MLTNSLAIIFPTLALSSVLFGNILGQSTETITCYSNNCTTLYDNITTCAVFPPSVYYPMPTCTVPVETGLCYTFDWPASSSRIFGCLTQRSCPYGYKCCASSNRCNCDPNFSTVLCPQNLTAIQTYPINALQPFVVNADYIKKYRLYVFEVWTNFTQPGANVTFTITSVTASSTVTGNVTKLFGIMPGSFINSAKIFIEADTNLETYLYNNNTAVTYTLTILAQSTGNALETSQQFTVRIDPYINHRPTLFSPSSNPYQMYIPEDTEFSTKLLTVCANDSDANLDISAMCQSLFYQDFYAFNDPSDRFVPIYNNSCVNVNASYVPSTISKSSFCIDIYNKAGAIFSVRDESPSYKIQVTFRDLWQPPAYLHVFINVAIVPRENEFWRYCFVCNKTTCPSTGTGRAKRCLPGQHYCCKRVMNQGSKFYYQADRFCSSIRADDEMAQVHCCASDYCNAAPSRFFFNVSSLIISTGILLFFLLTV